MKAALAAIKEVRGNPIKNAYIEGFNDGWTEHNGHRSDFRYKLRSPEEAWENSHSHVVGAK